MLRSSDRGVVISDEETLARFGKKARGEEEADAVDKYGVRH